MHSLIYHWNDKEFRKGVLITGHEEAMFYRPLLVGDDDTRAFVVVTVRNSRYEDLASGKEILKTRHTKKVTGSAVKFFDKVDFESLCGGLSQTPENDFYGVVEKYPAAWKALRALGTDINEYAPVKTREYKIKGKQRVKKIGNAFETRSGIDGEISNEFFTRLCLLAEGRSAAFYSDSFKTVSRNFEKLLKVMEFVLSRNKTFLTANYVITNGRLKKRRPLMRPAHEHGDLLNKLLFLRKKWRLIT
jgi:hypothetical protein